jgi:hypothetical protein
MGTIAELKEQSVTETPLLLFECRFADGAVERWSTHQVVYEGEEYEARVLAHRVFEIRSAPEEGIDATAKVTVILANADSKCSQIERARGWKGSRLRVRFLFYDLKRGGGRFREQDCLPGGGERAGRADRDAMPFDGHE